MKAKDIKNRLLNGESLEFTDDNDNHFLLWFNNRFNWFVLAFNSKVVKTAKTFKPIETKINGLSDFNNLAIVDQ